MNAYTIIAVALTTAGLYSLTPKDVKDTNDDITNVANAAISRNDHLGQLIEELAEELPSTHAEWNEKYPEQREEALRQLGNLNQLGAE